MSSNAVYRTDHCAIPFSSIYVPGLAQAGPRHPYLRLFENRRDVRLVVISGQKNVERECCVR